MLFLSHEGNAQVLGQELLGGDKNKQISIEYSQGFLILNVKFHQTLPLRFILDTGAEHIILFNREISDILGLEYEKRINLMGSDLGKEVYAFICRNVYISLENTPSFQRDIIVLEEDFLHLEELTGESIHGIIGSRTFRGLLLELDYRKSKIILHDPTQFDLKHLSDYQEFDLTIEKHKPYINATISLDGIQSIPLNILVDTGAALPFLVFLQSHPSLTLPDYFVKGNLGKGIGGDIEGFLGKVEKLSLLDSYEFYNVITSFQHIDPNLNPEIFAHRNGLIGNPILERFKVVIDFVQGKIYLKARSNYDKEFSYDKSGLVIYAFGEDLNNYYVKDVIEDSPAYEAGIRKGDMIKKIGIWPANFYSLKHILKKLKSKNGRTIKMVLERNTVKYDTKFKLRDYLISKTNDKT